VCNGKTQAAGFFFAITHDHLIMLDSEKSVMVLPEL
jgi:enoyl-CoA hydratase/carnithine racemase